MVLFLLLFLYLPSFLYSQQTNSSAPMVSQAKPSATVLPASENPKTPEEFFARARQLSDLEAAGIPFHLKATYVAGGDTEFTGNGTYEEWWQSEDIWRKEVTLGSYTWVAVQNGTKGAASATSDYMPLRVRQIQYLQIFHLVLPEKTQSNWEIAPSALGTSRYEMATEHVPCDPKSTWPVCIRQYEFSADGVLRSYRNNDVTETYLDFQPFGRLLFPRKIVSALRAQPIDTATVVLLEPLAGNNFKLFDVEKIPDLGTVPPGVTGATMGGIHPPKLLYSAQMKQQKPKRTSHPASVVIVECTIDTNGEVREPFVQLSANKKLDDDALEAIRNATFKPGRIKGHPVLVNMLLMILFHGPA